MSFRSKKVVRENLHFLFLQNQKEIFFNGGVGKWIKTIFVDRGNNSLLGQRHPGIHMYCMYCNCKEIYSGWHRLMKLKVLFYGVINVNKNEPLASFSKMLRKRRLLICFNYCFSRYLANRTQRKKEFFLFCDPEFYFPTIFVNHFQRK